MHPLTGLTLIQSIFTLYQSLPTESHLLPSNGEFIQGGGQQSARQKCDLREVVQNTGGQILFNPGSQPHYSPGYTTGTANPGPKMIFSPG